MFYQKIVMENKVQLPHKQFILRESFIKRVNETGRFPNDEDYILYRTKIGVVNVEFKYDTEKRKFFVRLEEDGNYTSYAYSMESLYTSLNKFFQLYNMKLKYEESYVSEILKRYMYGDDISNNDVDYIKYIIPYLIYIFLYYLGIDYIKKSTNPNLLTEKEFISFLKEIISSDIDLIKL